MDPKYKLNFVNDKDSVMSDKAMSEIALQTNHLANEQARANELKKIELILYAKSSDADPAKIAKFQKDIGLV